jgi:hypothetical protein
MHVAIDLPDEIARQLTDAWGDMPRKTWKQLLSKGIVPVHCRVVRSEACWAFPFGKQKRFSRSGRHTCPS